MKHIRRLFILLFAVVTLFLVANKNSLGASNASTVNVYFYKYDGNYTNYWVWFWTEHAGGKGKNLETVASSNGYTKKASFAITAEEQDDKIGVILVKSNGGPGSWGGADQTDDLYFKIDKNLIGADGSYNVYYAEGDDGVNSDPVAAQNAMKDKFLYVSFTSANEISYKATNAISNVVVKADGANVSLASSSTAKEGKLKLASNVDMSKSYTISAMVKNDQVTDKQVAFDGIYNSAVFKNAFTYDGNDLGANYTQTGTTFKLWAPISKKVSVKLYQYGHSKKYETTEHPGTDTTYAALGNDGVYEMTKGEKGVWSVTVPGDLDGVYYTYLVENASATNEVVDPYAKTTGLNGERGMVINFNSNNLNPTGWSETSRATATANNVDKVIYEAHIRDLTADASWGGNSKYAGMYMGLAQKGTTYTSASGVTVKTGLDHLVELGITHLHILPVMDSEYVDESRLYDDAYKALDVDGIYNWNYMTKYFFSIEGCYSTNPYDGYARLEEFKEMIMALHENNINVVMDVVYNHSSTAGNTNFQKIIPYYFHRTSNGKFTNGSGCGNELASERDMVRKLIVDSLKYFASEFKIDGFRFDLMALEDTTTMNQALAEVKKIDPNTIFYGEPWTGDGSAGGFGNPSPANKGGLSKMSGVAAFSDVTREGIRGGNPYDADGNVYKGWVNNLLDSGDDSRFNKTLWGVMGGAGYCNGMGNISGYNPTSPNQIVNYASCHDNFTLFDQIRRSGSSRSTAMDAVSQALGIILTSQGVAFIEDGSEFGKTKNYNHNSYNAGDATNAIKWNLKADNYSYFKFVKDLVSIRRNHQAFRQTTYTAVQSVVANASGGNCWFNDGHIIAYRLKDTRDTWNDIYVIHANSAGGNNTFNIPAGNWKIAASNNTAHKINDSFTKNTKLKANETIIVVNTSTTLTIPVANQGKKSIDGDAGQATIAYSAQSVALAKIPQASNNKDDIALVYDVLKNLIDSDSKIDVISGKIKTLMQNAILEMETTKFTSTTEVWNAFLKYRKLRSIGIEASDFALEMVAVPDDVMSNIYYILNQ